MRLIDVSDIDHLTFHFVEEVDQGKPKYAILSHRWREDEVSYEDVLERKNPNKRGWTKLNQFCSLIKSHGYQYGWIDACCIDKASSAELSEAINSMYMWYRCSTTCYAYLDDVPSNTNGDGGHSSALAQSEWFTRGWTLQELLSPYEVKFVDQEWHSIGTRRGLSRLISKFTHIPATTVTRYVGTDVAGSYSPTSGVGEVMSWAARRKTTRYEDRAYSLLGMLGVHLPAMYGERHNAFHRLQVQIVESCEDDSIFAWQVNTATEYQSFLAPTLEFFDGCRSRPLHPDSMWDKEPGERRMTNKGLRLEPLLRLYKKNRFTGDCFLMPLNCTHPNDDSDGMCAAICIQQDRYGKFWRCGNHYKGSAGSLPHAKVMKHSIDDREGFERKLIYAQNL